MTRSAQTHQPALLPQEAALLPAIVPGKPGHFTMPLNQKHFVPVTAEAAPTALRRGSVAGRAVLRAAGVHLTGIIK